MGRFGSCSSVFGAREYVYIVSYCTRSDALTQLFTFSSSRSLVTRAIRFLSGARGLGFGAVFGGIFAYSIKRKSNTFAIFLLAQRGVVYRRKRAHSTLPLFFPSLQQTVGRHRKLSLVPTIAIVAGTGALGACFSISQHRISDWALYRSKFSPRTSAFMLPSRYWPRSLTRLETRLFHMYTDVTATEDTVFSDKHHQRVMIQEEFTKISKMKREMDQKVDDRFFGEAEYTRTKKGLGK